MRIFVLIALFAISHPAQAGTIYKIYEGGVTGTLEMQFTTPAPLDQDYIQQNGLHTPITTITQMQLNNYAIVTPFGAPLTNLVLGVSAGNSSTLVLRDFIGVYGYLPPHPIFTLVFPTPTIPTLPGTYDLIPGQFVNPPSTEPRESPIVGSTGVFANYYHPFEYEVMFYDTLTIETESHMPEPASLVLMLTGIMTMLCYSAKQLLRKLNVHSA